MTPAFKKAIATVIVVHEGGFQKLESDPGNWRDGVLVGTKFGISARSFPDVDIAGLTIEAAEELYAQRWGSFALLEDQRVLTKVLDLAVNMQYGGNGPATTILQNAIVQCGSSCVVDGKFGPATAAAANAIDSELLMSAVRDLALAYYKKIEAQHPEEMKWFKNWEQRAQWIPYFNEQEKAANG